MGIYEVGSLLWTSVRYILGHPWLSHESGV